MNEKRKDSLKYSLLTVILCLFLVQAGVSSFLSVSKNIALIGKISTANRLHKLALQKNESLKVAIQTFHTAESLESIARNNLKMAGKDEALVVFVNDNAVNVKPKKTPKKQLVKKKR